MSDRQLALALRAVIIALQRSGPRPMAEVAAMLVREGLPESMVVDAIACGMGWGGFEEEPGTGRLGAASALGPARSPTAPPPPA
jgi:hypothetical protein